MQLFSLKNIVFQSDNLWAQGCQIFSDFPIGNYIDNDFLPDLIRHLRHFVDIMTRIPHLSRQQLPKALANRMEISNKSL